ncbi:hypothetical protein TCAL_15244 [Tigriopus californicus]|uniref:Uncharacterized protein n=1 Tax=Tigriopus californicus TaxID=6832 RepID=A0A553NEQ6_TIGCA|nr:hypothetical protein TCAL_15244 [Tigriopus californicus]
MDFNPDFEELEQILGNAGSIKEDVALLSPQNTVNNEDINNDGVLSFDLTMDHKTATHGGYIDGTITLPKRVCQNGILKLSPHPSSRSQQFLQPNLLHVTIMNNTKKSLWKSELTERDWQVLVRIRNSEAFLLAWNGSTYDEKPISFLLAWNGSTYDEKPICSLQNGNELPLGGDGLLLTTIIPLQNRKRGELDGAPTLKTKSDTVPIRAVFVIERNEVVILADKIYSEFQQIRLDQENFQVHQNTITFRVPPQSPSVLKHISRNQDILKIALYRPHDERFSKTKFRFDYIDHVVGECNFCAILDPLSSEGPRKSVRARRDHRRRTTNSGDASIYSVSSGIHSPSSGVYSPSGSSMDDWSPIPKRLRQNSGSAEETDIMSPVSTIMDHHPQPSMELQFPESQTLAQGQDIDFKTDQETQDILSMIPQDLYDLVPSITSTNAQDEHDESLARLISSTIDSNMESVERYFDRSFDCQDCGGDNQEFKEEDKGFNRIALPTAEDFETFENQSSLTGDSLVTGMEKLAMANDQGSSRKLPGFGWLNMALPVLASISLGLYMMEYGLQCI